MTRSRVAKSRNFESNTGIFQVLGVARNDEWSVRTGVNHQTNLH